MSESNDSFLVKQCLEGNLRAFEGLVDKYQKPIFNVAYRFLQNVQDAEDVTQAVFAKAFEKLQSFNTSLKFFSWIYKIAVNEALNFQDARKPNHELDENIASHDKSPEGMYDVSEIEQQVTAALGKLKRDYQMVIILKHFQDCKYEEMSQILDIPVKTVKSRLFSARQQLKEILIRDVV